MGPVLIRHVGSVYSGSRFGFKQKKKKDGKYRKKQLENFKEGRHGRNADERE